MAYVTTDRSGVPFSSSAPAVIGPSGGYTSGGSSLDGPGPSDPSQSAMDFASNVANTLQTSDGDYQNAVRSVFDYSEKNSAFNAEQAAISRGWSAEQNQLAMAASAAQAQRNREWQEMMSNTSHQRAVKDLVAAGLNPVLSAATGASTPSGAQGQGFASGGSSASADSASGALGSIFSSLVSTSAQAALNKQMYEYNSDLQSKQLATEMEKSLNQLRGTEMSSNATMAAAGTSALATRYSADTQREIQFAQMENQRLMQSLGFESDYYMQGKELENAFRIAELNNQAKMGSSIGGVLLTAADAMASLGSQIFGGDGKTSYWNPFKKWLD